jgi:hypothetical protein
VRSKLLREREAYVAEWVALNEYTMQDLRIIKVKGYTAANRRKIVIKATIANIDIALAMAL